MERLLALNKAKIVDRNGNAVLYTYDYRNLMFSKNAVNTSDNVNYSYDEVGNRISMVGCYWYNKLYYNANKWLTNVAKGVTSQISYTYDDVGNVISIKDKKGYITNYAYDKASRLRLKIKV